MVADNFEEGVQRAIGLLQGKNTGKNTAGQSSDFESGVQKAMQLLQNPKQNAELEDSWGDRALQVARGAAKTYGGIVDLTSEYRQGHPTMMADLATNFEPVQRVPEGSEIPKVTPMLTGKIDEFAGKNLTPKDKTGKVLETFGEFVAPLPIPSGGSAVNAAGKGFKALIKGVGKKVAKEVVPAVGASAAVNLTPELTEEGSIARTAEDIVKIILGTTAGAKANSTVGVISKRLENLAKSGKYKEAATNAVNVIKEVPGNLLARTASKGSVPDKEILDLAKKYDIDLPFNVGSNGRWQNFTANNIFNKSIFTSKAYETVLKNADEKMVKTVEEAIDTLGDTHLKPTDASVKYKDFMLEEMEAINKEKSTLYHEAYNLLKKDDALVPQRTIKAIDSLTGLLTRDIKSPDTKRVAETIFTLGEAWGILPSKSSLEEFQKSPELVKRVIEEFKKQSPKIGLDRLVGVREELQQIYKHDPSVKGVKKQLARLVGALTKDIQQTDNKAFLEKWQEANAFYKLNVAGRIETNIARDIMHGQAPELAFAYMGDKQGVELIKHITGESEKGKRVFDALKKAKVREIFANSFEKDGSLKTGNFANIFQKEAQQELLETLLGEVQYHKINDIAKIAGAFSQSGRQLLNTSGTAITTSELGKIEAIVGGISSLIGISVNSAPLAPAAGYIASVNLGSRLLSNPKFINQMHAYALARQAGKEKEATTILNRLINMMDTETKLKAGKYFVSEEMSKKEDDFTP